MSQVILAQGGDGSFKLVIGHEYEFDIDRLESALLQVNYPALRTAVGAD